MRSKTPNQPMPTQRRYSKVFEIISCGEYEKRPSRGWPLEISCETTSANRQHNNFLIGRVAPQRIEPALQVGQHRALDRQRHPAPDRTAHRDVAHRQLPAGHIHAMLEM